MVRRVQLLGSTRLSRVVAPFLVERAGVRVVGIDPGEEDETAPWFAPLRTLARDLGARLGRADADLVVDLDPDARPTRGEGPMIRVLAPAGAASPDVNRALLTGGEWAMVVSDADGGAAWAHAAVDPGPDDDGTMLMERAVLRGLEAFAEAWPALADGRAPTPLARPLVGGRWRSPEGAVLWHVPADRVVARIRAAAGPWGGAYATLGETRVTLLDAEQVTDAPLPDWLPGTVMAVDDGITVATGRGAVRLRRLRPGWRPIRLAVEYAAEVGLAPGYQFA